MSVVIVALFLTLLFACLGLHVFGLPGNWLLLGLVALWDALHPELHTTFGFYALLIGAALIGEVIEFAAQIFGARRYGASVKGNIGGFAGAIVGALFGAPFFLGFGALVGAVAGAFVGCYVVERFHGRDDATSRRAALGAMYGKVLGLTAKVACGVVMWTAAIRELWPA